MSRRCEVTGKGLLKGNMVSHAMNHTRKFSQPNLKNKRFWVPGENRWVRLRVSAAGIRLIAKNGIKATLTQLKDV